MKKITILFFTTVILLSCSQVKQISENTININPYQYSIQKKTVVENGVVVF